MVTTTSRGVLPVRSIWKAYSAGQVAAVPPLILSRSIRMGSVEGFVALERYRCVVSAVSETANEIRSRIKQFEWEPQRSHSDRMGREEADYAEAPVPALVPPARPRRVWSGEPPDNALSE